MELDLLMTQDFAWFVQATSQPQNAECYDKSVIQICPDSQTQTTLTFHIVTQQNKTP
jgi:hypothetical protein